MGTLKVGDAVRLKNGGTATVLAELGSGGQGTVYKVSYEGKAYALKWYHPGVFKSKEKDFYKNLQNNVDRGSPSPAFLWPLAVTEVFGGTFGYIMDLKPDNYHELTEFFTKSKDRPQIHFKSFAAQTEAAINIIQGFRELHNSGYSYQDINNGSFLIDPGTGNVLICDNDNVSPFGINLGILGKQRYMAPEVVTLQNDPDKQSDRFSMSVILFRLLFINHPLEGVYSTPPCMIKELERKFYGEEPVFIYDPVDNRNRPVPGTDMNLKLFWPIYPGYIKDLFVRAFSADVMHKRAPRVLEKEWLDAFFKLKAGIVKCPHCHQETFISQQGDNTCIECGKKIAVPNAIDFTTVSLPLYPGAKIMMWHVDSSQNDTGTQLGEVVANPNDPKLFGIKNTSKICWKVNLPSGNQKLLPTDNVVPIVKDFVIECTGNPGDAGHIK